MLQIDISDAVKLKAKCENNYDPSMSLIFFYIMSVVSFPMVFEVIEETNSKLIVFLFKE